MVLNITIVFPIFKINIYFIVKKVVRNIKNYIESIKNYGGHVIIDSKINHLTINQKMDDMPKGKSADAESNVPDPDEQPQPSTTQPVDDSAFSQQKKREQSAAPETAEQDLYEREPDEWTGDEQDLNEPNGEDGRQQCQILSDGQVNEESQVHGDNQVYVENQDRSANEKESLLSEVKDDALRDLSLYIDNKELLYYYALRLSKCLYAKDIAKVAVDMVKDENIERIDSETAVKARFFNLLVPLCPNIRKKTSDSNLRYYINEELAKRKR